MTTWRILWYQWIIIDTRLLVAWKCAASNPWRRYNASNDVVTCVKHTGSSRDTNSLDTAFSLRRIHPALHNVRVHIYITLPVGEKNSMKHLSWPRVWAAILNLTSNFSLSLTGHKIFGVQESRATWILQTSPHTDRRMRHCATIFEEQFCVSECFFGQVMSATRQTHCRK